jgi:N-acetylglutamate synthase-like GNAT family acetyltransferase
VIAGNPQLELRFGTTNDAAAEIELRRRVLAEPLGLPVEAVRFEFEARSLRLWALLDGVLIGCVLFHRDRDSDRSGRLYQMAVEPSCQKRGVGRLLVQRLEAHLRELGVREVRLHARGPSVGFYSKLGYAPHDAPFVEVGIEHRYMRREL